MAENRALGLIRTENYESYKAFDAPSMNVPEEYSYKNYLCKVFNQGQTSTCVPHSISVHLNWRENLKDGKNKDNGVSIYDIYNARTTPGDQGMSFVDAFEYIKNEGVKDNNGIIKITDYCRIPSIEMMKLAIIANGPCVGALPVYNSMRDEFWRREYGDLEGYHAISIVGYLKDDLVIRNSWGEGFGDKGYVLLPYNEINSFLEIWTILS